MSNESMYCIPANVFNRDQGNIRTEAPGFGIKQEYTQTMRTVSAGGSSRQNKAQKSSDPIASNHNPGYLADEEFNMMMSTLRNLDTDYWDSIKEAIKFKYVKDTFFSASPTDTFKFNQPYLPKFITHTTYFDLVESYSAILTGFKGFLDNEEISNKEKKKISREKIEKSVKDWKFGGFGKGITPIRELLTTDLGASTVLQCDVALLTIVVLKGIISENFPRWYPTVESPGSLETLVAGDEMSTRLCSELKISLSHEYFGMIHSLEDANIFLDNLDFDATLSVTIFRPSA